MRLTYVPTRIVRWFLRLVRRSYTVIATTEVMEPETQAEPENTTEPDTLTEIAPPLVEDARLPTIR